MTMKAKTNATSTVVGAIDPDVLSFTVGKDPVLDLDLAAWDCVGSAASVCENACTCSARPLFLKLQSRINAVLEETTVGELTEDHIEQKKRIEHARLS